MRTLASLCLCALAACSGRSDPFSPSPDLRLTHEYLRGTWEGTLTDAVHGTRRDLTADVGEGSRAAFFDITASVPGLGNASGEVQADENRWRAIVSSPAFGTLQMDGVIEGQETLRGSWRGLAPGGAFGDRSGTFVLSKTAAPAVTLTQEVYEFEGLTVILQRLHR